MQIAQRKVKSVIPPKFIEVYLREDLSSLNSESYSARIKTARGCGIQHSDTVDLITDFPLIDGATSLAKVIGIAAQACVNCPARSRGIFDMFRETCPAYCKK